jgi:hypothetical protein
MRELNDGLLINFGEDGEIFLKDGSRNFLNFPA